MNYSKASPWFVDSSKRTGRWRYSRERYVSDSSTRGLERAYEISDREAIGAFLRGDRSALSILKDAPNALDTFFGPKAKKVLRLVEDDEGARTLFCFVAFDGQLSEAVRALKSFDEGWWLERCAQVAGRLNFDFELV